MEMLKFCLIVLIYLATIVLSARLIPLDVINNSNEKANVIDTEDLVFFWKEAQIGKPCEPFTTFHTKCNKCICGADGVRYCTRVPCSRKNSQKIPVDENSIAHASDSSE